MTPQFKKRLVEFYKERYGAEADRREKSTERLSFSLLILSIIANICLTYLDNLPSFGRDAITIIFYIGLLLAMGCGGLAIYFYIRSLVSGYKFWHLPTPLEISKYLEKLQAYNITHPDKAMDMENEFEESLAGQYKNFASKNAALNDRRSIYIYKTSLCSVIAIIILLLCAPLFFYKKHLMTKPPQQVQIVEPVKIQQ